MLPFVVAVGVVAQSGVVLSHAASDLHASASDTALMFSYLNAGNLGGVIASIVGLRRFDIRRALVLGCAFVLVGLVTLWPASTLPALCFDMALFGFGTGVGVYAGAAKIMETTKRRLRAIVFLATDVVFGGGAFLFFALSAAQISASTTWKAGYAIVVLIPVFVLIALFRVRLTSVAIQLEKKTTLPPSSGCASVRVVLFRIALAAYVVGQDSFTIWAPSYLPTILGDDDGQASSIVSKCFGPSLFGLIVASAIVAKASPRIVLGIAPPASGGC